MSCVLVVEDEARLLRNLRWGLEEEGYDVLTATDGNIGQQLATTRPVDVVLLDVMLPGRDGFDVLSSLRAAGFRTPVLMLTARDAVEDRIRGLDSGADDYLVKPFAFAELLARLRVLLRRDPAESAIVLRADDLELNLVARRVSRAGKELDLSRREFDLLEYLLRNRNATVTREQIARDVWKDPNVTLTNVIDVYINHLRRKIERPTLRRLIQTVRGVGYRLQDDS